MVHRTPRRGPAHGAHLPRAAVAVVAAAVVLVGCSTAGPGGGASTPAAPSTDATTPTGEESPPSSPASDTPMPTTPVPSTPVPSTPATVAPSPTPTPTPTEQLPALQGLELTEVARDLQEPLALGMAGDTLVVAQKGGHLLAIEPDGTPRQPPLLALGDQVAAGSIEQGLLGFAFTPAPDDHRLFVYHSVPSNDNVLVEYMHDPDTLEVDPASRTELVTIDKEPDKVRHNGGTVLFGPDGMLWVSVGDAARASVNGQDPATLPGSILRLDVTEPGGYAIPPDNPFAGGATVDGVAGAPEVYWFGLRNPWRFSIDEVSGRAFIGNVGQETFEEVEVAAIDEPGVNFGWPAFEGSNVFYEDPPVTDPVGPLVEYGHDGDPPSCSITGGHVYRGAAIPELDGHYFHGDWCLGWIRSFHVDEAGTVSDERDWTDQLAVGMVSTFGVDADGELLVADWDAGTVSRVVAVR